VSNRTSTVSNSGRRTLTGIFIGPPLDVKDPTVFESMSLVAFLAGRPWIGRPEFVLLWPRGGVHRARPSSVYAVFLALLMALTVFIISVSYSQTIDQFPTGGGGYLVATKLLGRDAGLISGSALIVDYVLTISISIASGADAIFSFLPLQWAPYRMYACIAVVLAMVAMNLRGVKESVLTLLPIFISFVLMHTLLVVYALVARESELPAIAGNALRQVHEGSAHSESWAWRLCSSERTAWAREPTPE
jgi:amino acid transporter